MTLLGSNSLSERSIFAMNIPQRDFNAIRNRVRTISIQIGELIDEYIISAHKGTLSNSQSVWIEKKLRSLDKELSDLDRELSKAAHPAGKKLVEKPQFVKPRKDADILAFPNTNPKFYKED